MFPTNVTWPDVAGAFIIGLPALLAAIFSFLNGKKLKTANGKTIANLVEDVHAKESTSATAFAPESPQSEPPKKAV